MRGIISVILFLLVLVILTLTALGLPLIPVYLYCVFAGSAKRRAKVHRKINSMLIPGEEIVGTVTEYRIMSLIQRRVVIAVTNSRVLHVQRKIFGGYRMEDRQWKDLRDVRMDENIFPALFGTTMAFKFVSPASGTMQVWGVNPQDAAKVYAYSQAQEHAWEEKRRVRSLEEKRAVSGGINFHGFQVATPAQSEPTTTAPRTIDALPVDAVSNEIGSAKRLLDSGAISDAEFQEIKSKILSKHYG